MAKGFTKIGKGIYIDEQGNIGKLLPNGKGGWYIKKLDELPDVVKRAGKFERKQKIQNTETEELNYYKQLRKEGKVSIERLDEAEKTVVDYYKKRLRGKDTITDIPEAYRHYERDYEKELISREYGYGSKKLPEEKDYLPGGKKWNKEWESARETKFSKKEPSILKGATKEEKENYYRNKAERDKMKKMGTTAYLMEKEREKGNYKDEKVSNLQTKANEVVKGMVEDKKDYYNEKTKRMLSQKVTTAKEAVDNYYKRQEKERKINEQILANQSAGEQHRQLIEEMGIKTFANENKIKNMLDSDSSLKKQVNELEEYQGWLKKNNIDQTDYEDYVNRRTKLQGKDYNSLEEYDKALRKEYLKHPRYNKNDISPMSEYSGSSREGISYAQETSLNKMSLSELKEMANKYGIKTNMSKAKLISALISVFNK